MSGIGWEIKGREKESCLNNKGESTLHIKEIGITINFIRESSAITKMILETPRKVSCLANIKGTCKMEKNTDGGTTTGLLKITGHRESSTMECSMMTASEEEGK